MNEPARELLNRLHQKVPLLKEDTHNTWVTDGHGLKDCRNTLENHRSKFNRLSEASDYSSLIRENEKAINEVKRDLGIIGSELSVKQFIHDVPGVAVHSASRGLPRAIAGWFGLPQLPSGSEGE